jgi:putative addiction module component (TIGR02574 family)
MTATLNNLFVAAMELPDEVRLQLVEKLIPTIESDPTLEAEQIGEVHRRIEEVRSGALKTIAGADVFKRIEQSLTARRGA